MKTRSLIGLISLAVVLTLAACSPAAQTVTLSSTSSLDDQVTSAGAVGAPDAEELNVWDNTSNQGVRGFYSFDVQAIAPPSTDEFSVSSAILKLTMTDWFDTTTFDPIVALGNVVVELVEYGASLDAADYTAAAIGAPVTLATTTGIAVDFEADVTALIQQYIDSGDPDALVRWQFRLRHADAATNSDGAFTETEWATNENASEALRPALTVRYAAGS